MALKWFAFYTNLKLMKRFGKTKEMPEVV